MLSKAARTLYQQKCGHELLSAVEGSNTSAVKLRQLIEF